MSSFDNSQRSTSGLQLPGLVSQLSSTEQLPFPENNATSAQATPRTPLDHTPGPTTPAPDMIYPTVITQPLSSVDSPVGITQKLAFNASPAVTGLLPDLQSGTLSHISTTTSLRQPVVIRGTGKKSPGTMRPPKGRSWVIASSTLGALLAITLITGFIVFPLATGNRNVFGFFQAGPTHVQSNPAGSSGDVIAQEATTTACLHTDGCQPGYTNTNTGPTYTGSGVFPDRFAYGECTYWADYRYHQMTGYYVDWIGNAWQWKYGAIAAGWIVSTTPHYPSIIVLQPGVQGASYYGHVAVVEKINPDGSVLTSNMNWYATGGWNHESKALFVPGPGVVFVWHQ